MMTNLPIRYFVIGSLFLGVGFNFLMFSLGSLDARSDSQEWRGAGGVASTQTNKSPTLPAFLRAESLVQATEEVTLDITGDVSEFVYGGVAYRLSGLVIVAGTGAATLTAPDLEPIRITVGDVMPTGEQIESISLNEIVFLTEDAERDTVQIY